MSGRAPRMACNSDNPAIAAVELSDGELTFMTAGASSEDFRSQLWHDGLKLAVLSLGERGYIAITERSEIDTMGAGDAFVAGLLSGIANSPEVLDDDHALTELCRFANAVGAITTTARGAIPSLPTVSQVEAILAGQ